MMKGKKWMSVAPWGVFGVLVLIFMVGLHHSKPAPKPLQHVGETVPVTDLPVLGADGVRFSTAAWRGHAYVVNFFASWCADCKGEHEELMTLAAGHIPIIGILFKDRADAVTTYLKRDGNPFVAVVPDDDGRAVLNWGIAGVPETFVVDANGIIRWHFAGTLNEQVVVDELMPVWASVQDGK